MSIQITELGISRGSIQGPDPRITLRYHVSATGGELDDGSSSSSGTGWSFSTSNPHDYNTSIVSVTANHDSSDYRVRALVAAVAPLWYDILVRGNITVEQLGNGIWEAEVEYGKPSKATIPKRAAGTTSFSFQVGLQQTHITHSLQTVASYVAPGTSGSSSGAEMAPDFENAINVVREANGVTVRGLDIDVPVLEWEETHEFPLYRLTSEYIKRLYTLAGSINDRAWRTFGPAEVRFLGCTGDAVVKLFDGTYLIGNVSSDTIVPITFRFAASPTVTGMTIGTITGIEKRGWDYLWVVYEEFVENNELTKRPKYVYVERVFRSSNFMRLRLRSPWKVASNSSSSSSGQF